MVNYYCPGFFESQYMYNIYMWLWNEHRECFNDNVKISKVYGCFPGMTWNGGSYWIGGGCPLPKAEDMVEWYKEKGLTVQLTMTNPVLEERDLYDRYCNGILETLESEDVEILVASPTLEKHIRENYPKYKVDLSIIATTKERHEKTVDDYVKKLDDYNIVVLPRKYGKDIDALSKVPMDKRGRLEILCTDPCSIHCPRLFSHYEDMGRAQLYIPGAEAVTDCTGFNPDDIFHERIYKKHQITYQEICDVYEPMGYSEFKISGRIRMVGAILRTVPYLIKPEYQLDVYLQLFQCYSDFDILPQFD